MRIVHQSLPKLLAILAYKMETLAVHIFGIDPYNKPIKTQLALNRSSIYSNVINRQLTDALYHQNKY